MNPDTHPIFLESYDASHEAVQRIAERLRRQGHNIEVPPQKRAATRDEAMNCVDDGDLLSRDRFEVKKRSFKFTCAADIRKKGYKDFFVCSKNSFDRANPKPICYYILSECEQYAGIVFSKDSKYWTIRSVRDGRAGRNGEAQDTYCSPLQFVKFISLKDDPA